MSFYHRLSPCFAHVFHEFARHDLLSDMGVACRNFGGQVSPLARSSHVCGSPQRTLTAANLLDHRDDREDLEVLVDLFRAKFASQSGEHRLRSLPRLTEVLMLARWPMKNKNMHKMALKDFSSIENWNPQQVD